MRVRPALLPDDKRLFWGVIGTAILLIFWAYLGQQWLWIMVAGGLLFFLVVIPFVFHLIYFLLVQIRIKDEELEITDHISTPFVSTRGTFSMPWNEITHIYYLNDEAQALVRLSEKLKRFSLPNHLEDWRRSHLADKHGVPDELLRRLYSQIKTPEHFLVTKLNVKKFMEYEKGQAKMATDQTNRALVLSNPHGTRKLYLMNFLDLSSKGREQLIQAIKQRCPRASWHAKGLIN